MRLHVRFLSVSLIAAVAYAGMVGCQQQRKTGKVLVEVGNEVITEPDLDLLVKVNPRLKRRMETPAGKQQILNNYVEQALMFQEAKKKGLLKDPIVKAKIDLYKKVILAQALLEEKLVGATQQYFDEHKDEFEKVKIAHIYVPFKTEEKNRALSKKMQVKRSDAQAKKIADKIKADLDTNPDKFAEIAEKQSEDARTAKRAGELGWLAQNDARMRRWGWAKLVDKAFPLGEGTLTGPIKTENGYHIVKVLAPKKTDDYDQAQARIRFKVQAQIKSELVSELKKRYNVSFTGAEAIGGVPPIPPQPAGAPESAKTAPKKSEQG